MPEIFKCPSCAAPLKFKGTAVQTCKFCGSDVIAPAGVIKAEEKVSETNLPVEDESLVNAYELGQKAIKIAEIKRALKQNRTTSAAILFRDSFGGSLADAKEIVEAIESGESVYVPDFQTSKKSSSPKWIVFLVIAVVVIILFLIFLVK